MPGGAIIRPGVGGRPPLGSGRYEYTNVSDETGIAFALLRLAAGERYETRTEGVETALLVLSGRGAASAGHACMDYDRPSWQDHGPAVLHASTGTWIGVRADAASEFALVSVANPSPFAVSAFRPGEVRSERRGHERLDDTCTRIVRTVFDRQNATPESGLVLGEVVALPGRWSSYPPHHHPQPEVYYYRFDHPQGFGYAGLGDEVHKVRQHDLVQITGGLDHPQATAPGYTMYYLWAVRHLPGLPYTGFEFDPAHAWLWE